MHICGCIKKIYSLSFLLKKTLLLLNYFTMFYFNSSKIKKITFFSGFIPIYILKIIDYGKRAFNP